MIPRVFVSIQEAAEAGLTRFRTIQVYPKDLRTLPGHPEPAVSWPGGFRRGAHARPKTTPVHHPSRRRGGIVAARGLGAGAGKVPRIGFLYPGAETLALARIATFREGLRATGYREPDQVELITRVTGGDPGRVGPMARELVER